MIDSEGALTAGLDALVRLDPLIGDLVRHGAQPLLRRREPGFAGLASIVVSQQVSTASAAAIWIRVTAAFQPMGPATILAASEPELRGAGLSGPKIRTLRALAVAVESGDLRLEALCDLPPEAVAKALTAIPGIGPWTAGIYGMFCLGHPDAFAAGDLALQEAARTAYGLPARPDARTLEAFAERWRPWRAVAARVLWAYYRLARGRDGMPPS